MIVPPPAARPAGFRPGTRCDKAVNLIDLFPTVIAMAGLEPSNELEGASLLPLVNDPESAWTDHTVTTFGRGNHAITTKRWRFIQYFDGSAELYDRATDPHEWNNLIDDPQWRRLVSEFRERVPHEPNWRHFIRLGSFKAVIPADGSPMLLFNHAVENHLEERDDESAMYPDIVEQIATWLKTHPTDQKRIVIPVDGHE